MLILKPHGCPVHAIAFSPDGGFLASSAADGSAKITDLQRQELVQSFPGRRIACSLAISSDGKYMALGGIKVTIWKWLDFGSIPLVDEVALWSPSLAFAPNCKVIAIQGEENPVRRWSLPSGHEIPGGWGGSRLTTGHREFPTGCIVYSPDGSLLASAFGVFVEDQFDSAIMLWNASTGSLEGRLQTSFSFSHPTAIAFSPDGSLLAGAYGPTLNLFDVASQKLVASVRRGRKHFKGLIFAPDGRKLITVSNNWFAGVWHVPTLSEETEYGWSIGKLTAVAMAPDGLRVAAASDSGKVIVWDMDG